MYKVTITPFNGMPAWIGEFDTIEEANSWLGKQKEKVFRKPARWISLDEASGYELSREDERRTVDNAVEIHVPDDATYLVEDITDINSERALQRQEEMKIRMAPRIFAVLSALNIQNEFTLVEKQQQMGDVNLTTMKTLVEHSAFLEAKSLLESYVPTAYFTTPMKNKIINKIDEILTEIGEM